MGSATARTESEAFLAFTACDLADTAGRASRLRPVKLGTERAETASIVNTQATQMCTLDEDIELLNRWSTDALYNAQLRERRVTLQT